VLGKLMEEYLRRSILMSRGDWSVFVDIQNRPISAGLIAIAVIMMIVAFLPAINKKRDAVFTE
jgi:putative tricarboxylic transport membrane protein